MKAARGNLACADRGRLVRNRRPHTKYENALFGALGLIGISAALLGVGCLAAFVGTLSLPNIGLDWAGDDARRAGYVLLAIGLPLCIVSLWLLRGSLREIRRQNPETAAQRLRKTFHWSLTRRRK